MKNAIWIEKFIERFIPKGKKIMKKLNIFLLLAMATILTANNMLIAEELPVGTIKGRIIDKETMAPLPGSTIKLLNTKLGGVSKSDGNFVIKDVPVGSYTIQFSYIGYESKKMPDIIVKSDRITFVNTELMALDVEIDDVVVTGGYFANIEEVRASDINFSYEEIRRSPGTAGDVSRIIYSLPAVAKVNDQMNSLIVRGGSPSENSFFIDNIEITNINHFPQLGATGGPIGMVNVDFIDDVNFHSGGFPVIYGDRLSSVMDISFRNGNIDEFDGQLDLNMAGFGGSVEGPVGNGSFLFSAKRSYLDLIVDAIGEGDDAIPEYSDYQAKFIYDLSDDHRITFIDVLGVDFIDQKRDSVSDIFGPAEFNQNTAGLNWRYLWGESGYSKTSVSHSIVNYDLNYKLFNDNTTLVDHTGSEQEFRLRNVNYYKLNNSHKFEFGAEIKHIISDYDHYYGPYNDPLGGEIPSFEVNKKINASKIHGFISYTWKPYRDLSINPGVRVGYFAYNENLNVAPRLSLNYRLTENTSLNLSGGLFYQNLPLSLLAQNENNKSLKDPLAIHTVLGLSHMLTESTRLTIELYDKQYRNCPVDATQPSLFILDEVNRTGFFLAPNPLSSTGEAYSRGIEVMVQKKLAEDFYGLVSASWFRTRYSDYNGDWHDRDYDNKFSFNLEGGYKPNNTWEFSARWIIAGGRPYTPYDLEASHSINRGVYQADNINGDRLPAYHSLNIRADRRFYFSGSNLTVYISIWNAYNRKNVAKYEWDEVKNEPKKDYMWALLPIFGLEFEF